MSTTNELGTKPIITLLAKYSIPAVVAMLVNAIYNVVDRIFIGQFAGENALAGLTIAFPVMVIIFAFASLIGEGGAALLSIRFGEQDGKGANNVFGNTLSFGLIVTTITLIVVFINLDGVIALFGGTTDTTSYAVAYMSIILGGFIFQMISYILTSAVRTEGQPNLSMIAMVTSALVNIVLDYIFIGLLNMGVVGAAYATIAGQFAGLAILLSFYVRGKSQLKLTLQDLKPNFQLILKIVTIGFASFVSTVGISIALAMINRSLSLYAGTAGVTSMGAINSLYTFFIMPIMGITQGMQPIMGYNHGAKNNERVTKTLKYGVLIGVVFSVFVFTLLEVFPVTFISMFLDSGSETLEMAVNGLRIYMIMLPLLSLSLMGITYFQATEQGRISVILGTLRQFVFLIPLLFVLPNFFGINGVWMSIPIADGMAIIVTTLLLVKDRRKAITAFPVSVAV